MPSTTLVGLDVGSTSVRAVEATVSKDSSVVGNFGRVDLPRGAVVAGVIKDDKAVTAALRQLWSTYHFGTRDVALGVTHQQVVVREVRVANLPPKELRQALPFLVRDQLPLPVDEAVIDFHPLEDPGKNETVSGLIVAAPKLAVIATVKAVEAAGLHVAQVDLSVFAALRAAAHLAEDTEALVDLGADATNIVIHVDGTPKVVRTVPRGGTEITSMLATRLGISHADAEQLKCRYGVSGVSADPNWTLPRHGAAGEFDSDESAEVVAEALRPLINEIRSSFAYFSTTHPGVPVRRLALVGGAALLPGLADELTKQLGVQAFLSDPLQRVDTLRRGKQQDAAGDLLSLHRSSAAVSIGLTLGAA